jgi:hypothetical protein
VARGARHLSVQVIPLYADSLIFYLLLMTDKFDAATIRIFLLKL